MHERFDKEENVTRSEAEAIHKAVRAEGRDCVKLWSRCAVCIRLQTMSP